MDTPEDRFAELRAFAEGEADALSRLEELVRSLREMRSEEEVIDIERIWQRVAKRIGDTERS